MKKPPYEYRIGIIMILLTAVPIGATHCSLFCNIVLQTQKKRSHHETAGCAVMYKTYVSITYFEKNSIQAPNQT